LRPSTPTADVMVTRDEECYTYKKVNINIQMCVMYIFIGGNVHDTGWSKKTPIKLKVNVCEIVKLWNI